MIVRHHRPESVKRLLPLYLAALLLPVVLVGCGKKAEPPPATEPAPEPSSAASSAAPADPTAPPVVFSDPVKQQQFATLFDAFSEGFYPPAPGTLIRIEKTAGSRVEGDLVRFTQNGIMLATDDGMIPITRDEMTPATRLTLFVDEFSRQKAEEKVTAGLGDTPTDPYELFLKPISTENLGPRRLTAERLVPRLGPGRFYAPVDETEIFRGQQVFVVDEEDGWICIKAAPDDTRLLGWVPKFASFVLNPENRAAIKEEVDLLLKNGLLIDIDPTRNEALIDLYAWRISDSASVEGIARLLAYYSGQQKGSRLYWVDIKDALSGRRIAEYSESKGFRVY